MEAKVKTSLLEKYGLATRKTTLQTELLKVQQEDAEYDTLFQNVSMLLKLDTQRENEREELELQ